MRPEGPTQDDQRACQRPKRPSSHFVLGPSSMHHMSMPGHMPSRFRRHIVSAARASPNSLTSLLTRTASCEDTGFPCTTSAGPVCMLSLYQRGYTLSSTVTRLVYLVYLDTLTSMSKLL